MTLVIELEPESEARLRKRASRLGREASEVARSLLEHALSRPALLDLLEPVRREFEESGLSEAELDDLIDAARAEVWGGRTTAGQT